MTTGEGFAPIEAKDMWAAYERKPASMKAKAAMRAKALAEVEELTFGEGTTKTSAVALVASRLEVSPRAINRWFAQVLGVAVSDRPAFLISDHKGGRPNIDVDPVAWRILKEDYLRREKPSFASCYRRLRTGYAKANGIPLPSAKTLHRRMVREVPKRSGWSRLASGEAGK
ncbi:DNA-binding domain-containing protein [Sphingomonas oryzagri]